MKFYISILSFCLLTSVAHAQESALKQLNGSPRHHEWVDVPVDGRNIRSFIAYPQNAQNSLAVIVVHENKGLTDWVRSFADQLAAEGYLAIAPDLLSGFDAEHETTADFKNPDDARNAIYKLDPAQVTTDLMVVQRYAAKLSSANGKTAVIGFCWGGGQSFRLATVSKDLTAALVFYGSPPTDDEQIQNISAPVYGFYGENDQRINATIPETEQKMNQYEKIFDYQIYTGAGHAFMRDGDDPSGLPENKKARDDAWERIKQILSHEKQEDGDEKENQDS